MGTITEADRIKAAFTKGLLSARARGGSIDESSHEIFHFTGINSGAAAHEIGTYLLFEKQFFEQTGLLPTYMQVQQFLDNMALKYTGCTLFVMRPDLGVNLVEEKTHEKNDTDERSSNTRAVPEVSVERVFTDHELHAPRREGDQNTVERALRKSSGKNKAELLRAEPLSRPKKRLVKVDSLKKALGSSQKLKA